MEQGELILRLYGLFQGLFVSIDSLYSLAYALTNSKSFININQNPELRQLKYIRNDVVGHPANRVYNNLEIGYCLLPKENIKADSFSYYIYSQKELKTKDVNILTILDNYYLEANNLLNNILSVTNKLNNSSDLTLITSKIYDSFLNNQKYLLEIKHLKKRYLEIYSNSNKYQHRLLWRIDLIERLSQIKTNDTFEKEIYQYAIMFEIIKLHELACKIENKDIILLSNKLPVPKLLKGYYKMLNNNQNLIDTANNLHDMTHPLFQNSLEKCFSTAIDRKLKDANSYLSIISNYNMLNNSDMVYAIGILAKQYKKR